MLDLMLQIEITSLKFGSCHLFFYLQNNLEKKDIQNDKFYSFYNHKN